MTAIIENQFIFFPVPLDLLDRYLFQSLSLSLDHQNVLNWKDKSKQDWLFIIITNTNTTTVTRFSFFRFTKAFRLFKVWVFRCQKKIFFLFRFPNQRIVFWIEKKRNIYRILNQIKKSEMNLISICLCVLYWFWWWWILKKRKTENRETIRVRLICLSVLFQDHNIICFQL